MARLGDAEAIDAMAEQVGQRGRPVEMMMKKLMVVSLVALSPLMLAGCNSPYPQDRAASGAVLGGAAGALIGGAATGRPGGALVGGLAGAATGAVVGAASTPPPPPPPPGPPRCARFGYDYNGNPICVQYY